MIRLYRLVPIAAPLILLLATMQLMAASAAPTMASMPSMKNTSSTETSQAEGLMFWSQSVDSGERMVLLQWQPVTDPPHQVFLPMLLSAPGSSATHFPSEGDSPAYTIFRRQVGDPDWQTIGTSSPAANTTEMVATLGRDLADQLLWDLRVEGTDDPLTDQELYDTLLSSQPQAQFASESFYQVDLVRGLAFMDQFAPLNQPLEYYVAGPRLVRYIPVLVDDDATLPAPTGLREVFPGPDELGKPDSTYPDNTEVRYRWDFYQQWREWDGSVSLYWDTPTQDPEVGDGTADSEETIGMQGYHVERAESGTDGWLLVNPVGDCQTGNQQYCTLPIRVSALPEGGATDETLLFRDQLSDQFQDQSQVYKEWDYRVCAVDLLGGKSCSDRITAYGRDLNPPEIVSDVQVDQPDGGPIQLSWTYTDPSEVSGPVRFYVTRHMTLTTPADQWQPVYPEGSPVPYVTAGIEQPVFITITDSPNMGTPYWYQIQVRDGAGNFSPYGAPLMGALFPRNAPPLNKIDYDDLSCQNNPMPLTLNGLDSSIQLLNLYRGFTNNGPWSLVEQVPVIGGSAEIADDFTPATPINAYYAIEAVDANGNVSQPAYYCTRLDPGSVPPPPGVDTDLIYEGEKWYIPVGWIGDTDSVEIVITQPGAEGTSSTTVTTTDNPYMAEVNMGAWIETTVSGQNGVGIGEGTTVTMHPTNNYLDTNRQMTDLGRINNLTWVTTSHGLRAVQLDLTGTCDQCSSVPMVAAFRRSLGGSWLQVTPVQDIPRPSSDAPWIITDTTDLSPNESYEYTVLAISPDSYEVLGYWGSNKLAPEIPNQAPIQFSERIAAASLWPKSCPYDGTRPSTAGLPRYVDLANGWVLDVRFYFTGSGGCAPVTFIDPGHLYGEGSLSNGSATWTMQFGDIAINPETEAFTRGRIVHDVGVTIDESDRLPTRINRIEFVPGAARGEVTITMPGHVNIHHEDQGRSNEIFYIANNVQTDLTFNAFGVNDLYVVDERLPWTIHYPQGSIKLDKIGSISVRAESETIDRFAYPAPGITTPAVPDNNLAFMRPQYTSSNAAFDRLGMSGDFVSTAAITYSTSLPAAVVIEAQGANLTIQDSAIQSGVLGNTLASFEYLDQDTVKDYMLFQGRCSPNDPEVKFARCYETLDPDPPSYQTIQMIPAEPDIAIGAGGVLTPVVYLDTFPQWTRYEVEADRGTLFIAAAAVSGEPTSWAPMPVENAWSQLPHPDGPGDLDPGINVNEFSEPASYSCYTPARFDWSVTDLYMRRGGVSEYFYTGEDLPSDRTNQFGYTEQVFHVELLFLDNTEEPIDFRTNLILPYPSEVTYPLEITSMNSHCPAGGDISEPTTAVHRYWEFEESPTEWVYLHALEKYEPDIGNQEALFALYGSATINGLNYQSTSQAGATVVRTLLSEWFPDGDAGDIQLLADDYPAEGYRVSGIKFNLSDVKLSRYYNTVMDDSSLPDTLGIDQTANAADLPAELLEQNGSLTPASLKNCSLTEIDGCGFILLDGDGAVDYFGEIYTVGGANKGPSFIPIDELAGAFPIAVNEVLSRAVQMVVDKPEVHWIWPIANTLINDELQKYNIPVKFLGNTEGAALVGVLANASIMPGELPEIITADLAATITVDWNDQRGYDDQIGIFAGYTASQAAFRALTMNRPRTQREGVRQFDLWEDVESDIAKWAVDFGYALDPGPDNDEDDPVDLAALIWEDEWCQNWDPSPEDPERECTDRVTDLGQIYNILEPMLQDMNGHEAYGPLAVAAGVVLQDANVKLNNGAGVAIFSPVGLNNLRFESFQFGIRFVLQSEDDWRDANLIADWLQFEFTRDGQYIFRGTNVNAIIVGEYGIESDILFIVDTRPGSQHVEGGIEVDTIEVPLLFTARMAGVVGGGYYDGVQSGFVGLRGEASTDDLWGIENEMSVVLVAGLLPAESVVIDEFGFGDVLDKFGNEDVQGGPVPYTGAYFALAGQMPLIEGTCLLQAGGGGEIRLWYFQAGNNQDKYGGQIEAQVSATILCLLSGRGEVSLGFEKLLLNDPVSPPPGENPDWGPLPRYCEDPDSCFAFTGSVWFAIGVGYCSPENWDSWSGTERSNWWGDDWCYTFGAMLGLSYLTPPPAGEYNWKADIDLDYE